MKRLLFLIQGILFGALYALVIMLLTIEMHQMVSTGYIFILPLFMGAIPALFATEKQLKNYLNLIILPWGSLVLFIVITYLAKLEGLICLIIIIAPFLLLGTLGTFIYRIIKLKMKGDNSNKLYLSFSIPILFILLESLVTPSNHIETVTSKMIIESSRQKVWENIKNVKEIQNDDLESHFIYLMGIPKPMKGILDKEGIGGTRNITWQKGLKFKEVTTSWNEGYGFEYDIIVNTDNLVPRSLDEHVMIGGRYFDVFKGSYTIKQIDLTHQEVILTSTYRITSTVNFYGRLWTNFIIDDFQTSILEVIKKRSEAN